jgi:hypothetical protein
VAGWGKWLTRVQLAELCTSLHDRIDALEHALCRERLLNKVRDTLVCLCCA